MKEKNFCAIVFGCVMLGLLMFATPIIVVDPYFHYHAPLKNLFYTINNERYQNNGISRHFEYNALITGTSMTENFRTSELDELFDVKSVKVPYNGGRYKEISKNMVAALENNKNIQMIVRAADYTGLILDKDDEDHEAREDYPHYLNDKNVFNDVNYIFNKEVFRLSIEALGYRGVKNGHTSFDDYANWNKTAVYGKDSVLGTYNPGVIDDSVKNISLSEKEKEMIRGNVYQNIVSIAEKYPEVDFYIFFPPYSVCWWGELKCEGKIEYQVEVEEVAIKELLKSDNIRFHSFSDNFEWTCNLDNYKDQAHYGEWINSAILEAIYKGEHLITEDNYEEYLNRIREFYSNYDYSELYGNS